MLLFTRDWRAFWSWIYRFFRQFVYRTSRSHRHELIHRCFASYRKVNCCNYTTVYFSFVRYNLSRLSLPETLLRKRGKPSPGRPRNKWLDHILSNSKHPPADLWRCAHPSRWFWGDATVPADAVDDDEFAVVEWITINRCCGCVHCTYHNIECVFFLWVRPI